MWTNIHDEFKSLEQQRLMTKLAGYVKALNGLTPAELAELLSHAQKCTFAVGATIIKEGSNCHHMYIIIEGEVVVSKKGAKGKAELARLKTADSFGEMALADRKFRCATVTALSPCILIRVGDEAMANRPETGMKIYRNISRVLSERLRVSSDQLAWRI